MEQILQKLRSKERFSFARYGDGELNAMLGVPGGNCDEHQYFPDMGKRLREIVEFEPDYMMGWAAVTRQSGPLARAFKDEHPSINWVDADMLHLAAIEGTIFDFFDALKERDVVLVGPEYLRQQTLFPVRKYITIPDKDCWLAYDETLDEIVQSITYRFVDGDLFDDDRSDTVVLYAASMMSEVLIDDMSDICTNIDIGSLLDPYLQSKAENIKTRSHTLKIRRFKK